MLHFPELLVNFICFCVLAGFNTRPGHSEKMFHPGGGMKQTELISPSPFPQNHDESTTKISLKGFCKYSKDKIAIANIYLLITIASAVSPYHPVNKEYKEKAEIKDIIQKVKRYWYCISFVDIF